ncbi:hypothetical protein FIBSPDRAFT_848424 [Athelia psychrophila]|uniref:Uncharacterized protein n=1 Tax=Athelia psychrophila TaxID=1759441 RepID=A0A166VDG4_9AGAM|nr:hypothetical protein FIBSPDRAFT_848424 [Fibularhizoctonia sp. CBS 109695]
MPLAPPSAVHTAPLLADLPTDPKAMAVVKDTAEDKARDMAEDKARVKARDMAEVKARDKARDKEEEEDRVAKAIGEHVLNRHPTLAG